MFQEKWYDGNQDKYKNWIEYRIQEVTNIVYIKIIKKITDISEPLKNYGKNTTSLPTISILLNNGITDQDIKILVCDIWNTQGSG